MKGKKTGGRTQGTPNKLTASAKEAFALAFDALGGYEAMVAWAKSDPDNRKVFYTLYARLIPVDVTTEGKALTFQVIRPNADTEQEAG